MEIKNKSEIIMNIEVKVKISTNVHKSTRE